MKKGENNHRSKTHENEQSSEDYGCSKENSLEAIELPSAGCHKVFLTILMIAAGQTFSREPGHD